MAVSAVFGKAVLPMESVEHDGSDRQKGITQYQMVPVGRSREILIRVSGGAVLIDFLEEGVIGFNVDANGPFTSLVLDHEHQTDHRITLHGRKAGRARLLAVHPSTKQLLNEVIVSVKTERIVTVGLVRLSVV